MALDAEGNNHPDVGTGAASFWHRPTNRYAGCTCPPWRYNPSQPKPTDPNCKKHGGPDVQPDILPATA